ncbi:MAG: septum site-determining protein MinD [Ruminococcaceae bacterium]|nr:septum site-determining protein MinD [Oscillospiraceae bacterium]
MGELIAVLSGKGGTGKTSLCAGIATALAQMGEKVLCIDCDIGLRNLDISLAMSDVGALSFVDMYRDGYQLSQAATHRSYPTLSFLTAPVNLQAEDVDTQAFSDLLRQARREFSYVFLDAPAGLDAGFRLCAAYADRVILVTNPEPSAIRDAARTGQTLELMKKTQVRIVVNRVTNRLLEATRRTIDDVMDESGLPLLGVVPEDESVTLAAAFETPLLKYTRKGASAACTRIAKRIQGRWSPIPLR